MENNISVVYFIIWVLLNFIASIFLIMINISNEIYILFMLLLSTQALILYTFYDNENRLY